MSSVFGSTRVPVFHNGTSDTSLTYCKVITDEPEPDLRIFESVVNGYRSSIVKGYRWKFDVQINLWKATTGAANYLLFLYQNLGGDDHRIKRFGDDDYLRKDASNYCYFTMTEIIPGFLTQARDKDVVIVKWLSNDYVDMVQHLT